MFLNCVLTLELDICFKLYVRFVAGYLTIVILLLFKYVHVQTLADRAKPGSSF
jgi:hypothetical protein